MKALKAPFPWFGGKSRVAHIVWDRFGAVPNYVEPFCKGQTMLTHTPQECLAHTRQRLRDMTERRDALQVSLDNAKRAHEKLRARFSSRLTSVESERDAAQRALVAQRSIARKAVQIMRKLGAECARFLEGK